MYDYIGIAHSRCMAIKPAQSLCIPSIIDYVGENAISKRLLASACIKQALTTGQKFFKPLKPAFILHAQAGLGTPLSNDCPCPERPNEIP